MKKGARDNVEIFCFSFSYMKISTFDSTYITKEWQFCTFYITKYTFYRSNININDVLGDYSLSLVCYLDNYGVNVSNEI